MEYLLSEDKKTLISADINITINRKNLDIAFGDEDLSAQYLQKCRNKRLNKI